MTFQFNEFLNIQFQELEKKDIEKSSITVIILHHRLDTNILYRLILF